MNFYDNTQRYKTIYNKNIATNVQPDDYQYPLRVTKQQVEKPLLSTAGKSITNSTQTISQPLASDNQRQEFKLADSGIDLHTKTISGLKKNVDPEIIKAQEYKTNSEMSKTVSSTNDFGKNSTRYF